MTLIELMVAMLIGLFLMAGSVTIFVQSRANYRVTDSAARLQENARFAVDAIAPDIRLAKFWGRNNGAASITVPAGINVTCGTNGADITNWALDLNREVRVVDDDYTALDPGTGNAELPCPPPWGTGSVRDQSDALVLRHASGAPTAPLAGRIQVRSDLASGIESGILFNDGINPPTWGGAGAQTHDVVINVYYVSDRSDFSENVPSLRMQTLDDTGVLQDQELITGVENLQVLLGVDLNGDGAVEQYVDDHGDIAAGAQVVALRLWMLMRTGAQEIGYVDIDTYATPDPEAAAGEIVTGNTRYPADVRRLRISRTVALRNNRTPSI